MRSTAMMARWLFALGFTGALLTAVGCSSGNDATATPALSCTDGGAAGANAVVMNCVTATDSTTEELSVMLGGPATGTTTLRGLNFDVTYDPAMLEFVPAGSYSSPLFPNALIAVSLFNGQQGRVVVSIQQVVGAQNVAVGAGSVEAVLSLSFRSAAGTTFGSAPLTFANAEATSSSNPITFANGLALSYQ